MAEAAVAAVAAEQSSKTALQLASMVNEQLSKQIIGWEEVETVPSKSGKVVTTTKKISLDGYTILFVLASVAGWEVATMWASTLSTAGQTLDDILNPGQAVFTWMVKYFEKPSAAGAKPQAKSAMGELDNNLQMLFYQFGSIVPGLIQKLQEKTQA